MKRFIAGSFGQMSFGYESIATALVQHKESYSELIQEIENFIPRPEESFEEELLQETEQIQKLNPNKPKDEIAALVERMKKPCFSSEHQFSQRFSIRLQSEYAQIVMLSHALCEAFGNAAIALGLSESDSHDLFDLIEKAGLKDKWILGPLLFEPTYQFPKDGMLHETLVRLCRARNGLVHHKSTVFRDGTRVLKGTPEDQMHYKKRDVWIKRFLTLPYDLMNHGRTQFSSNLAFFVPIP